MTKFNLHIINNKSYVTNAKQMRGKWWLCDVACLQIDEKNHIYILCNNPCCVYSCESTTFYIPSHIEPIKVMMIVETSEMKINLKHLKCKLKIDMTMKKICARMLKEGELKSPYQIMG